MQYLVSLVVSLIVDRLAPPTDTLYMRLATADKMNTGAAHWIQGTEGWKSKLTDAISPMPTKQNGTN